MSGRPAVFTLGELAQRFGLELHGDARREIHGVATLALARAGQLGFLANPRYRSQLAATKWKSPKFGKPATRQKCSSESAPAGRVAYPFRRSPHRIMRSQSQR